jgi:hypothetical protein
MRIALLMLMICTMAIPSRARDLKEEWRCDARAAVLEALAHPRPGTPYVPEGVPFKDGWCSPAGIDVALLEQSLKVGAYFEVTCAGKPRYMTRYVLLNSGAAAISLEPLPPHKLTPLLEADCPPKR